VGRAAILALSGAVARVTDIFGVFDLSFFVAGAVCFGAVVFGTGIFAGWARVATIVRADWKPIHVGAIVVCCYVLGIICFAAGRKLRQDRTFYAALPKHLQDFGLLDRYAGLVARGTGPDAMRRNALLYARLWAEVRETHRLAPSFNLLTRYWVMAAMCDGLFAAFSIWCLLWIVWSFGRAAAPPPPGTVVWLGGVGLAAAAALSSLEAQRYGKAQMYELCATIAHAHASLGAEEASEG
jgi:hypothetical protein